MEMPFSPSGALIKHPFAGLLLGEGPFRESAVPPESGAAFYVNTFHDNSREEGPPRKRNSCSAHSPCL